MNKIISIKAEPCPKCEGKRFKYHTPEERQSYKGVAVIGKYECSICGWQSGLKGEIGKQK